MIDLVIIDLVRTVPEAFFGAFGSVDSQTDPPSQTEGTTLRQDPVLRIMEIYPLFALSLFAATFPIPFLFC